jgi:hypothetical protein
MQQTVFQYYPARVKSNTPIGCLTLQQFVQSIRNPKPHIREIFAQIKQAEEHNDKERKAQLKQNNLYYFTPCVIVNNRRKYENINSFTGLAVLDFDHIDNATDLKQHLFNTYTCILAAWLSPSAHGLKCLVHIPQALNITHFKMSWFALRDEFEVFDGWDDTTKNAVLPLFQSYDPYILYRDADYTMWTKQTKDYKARRLDPIRKNIPYNAQPQEKRILRIADSGITRISEPGHPQLRSICIALGGYAASGYIDLHTLTTHVHNLIECNAYLQKGPEGYKKTADWAIQEGLKNPIRL